MLLFTSCSSNTEPTIEEIETNACTTENLLENFTDPGGNNIFIYKDGKVFLQNDTGCNFELQYFDPAFEDDNYSTTNDGIFIKEGSDLIPVKNNFQEDFEVAEFTDLFSSDANNEDFFWTNFTLQSPLAKEVADYVALSKCILEGFCDFRDNRMDIIADPTNPENQVLKFTAVKPTSDMVTSKSSLGTVLNFFKKTDEVWFQADYFIEEGMPYSIVDFENSYFEGAPGPRVVIRENKLVVENKFGNKAIFFGTSDRTVPVGEWFTVKVYLKYSNEADGVVEIYQDGERLFRTIGINLPTANAIQNILEVGISATDEETVLLMDNIRISDTSFE
ncbi:heparin lyase I family protein [Maribacter sp. 2210JD10-5]|uniref:heparin lyase I family protein n=1 Tax=Maribacter sp. 2210JD10-5 TaxID=3386272 RepID=UPI0039BD4E0E